MSTFGRERTLLTERPVGALACRGLYCVALAMVFLLRSALNERREGANVRARS